MEFTRTVRNVNRGAKDTFTLGEDADFLTIETEGGNGPWSIHFDWLMENKHKLEVAEALAVETFFTNFMLRQESRLPKLVANYEHFFTSDDYEFALAVQAVGIPLPIAIRISYLTSYSMEDAKLEERKEILAHFMEMGHMVRQQNTGWAQGMTTLEPYILIALNSNLTLADKLVKQALHFPDRLFLILAALAGLMKTGLIEDDLTPQQLTALLAIIDSDFPSSSRDHDSATSKAIIRLVNSIDDWAAASLNLNNSYPQLVDYLSTQLGVNSYNTTNTRQVTTIVSLLVSRYSEDAVTKAVAMMRAHNQLLRVGSSHFFAAFVAVTEHMDTGGDADDQLDWIVSLDPTIDQDDLFNRVLIVTKG